MGVMHKEVIERKKAKTIILSIVFICIMISLSQITGQIKVNNYAIEWISEPIFIIITIGVILLEVLKCNIKYKYSIVMDKLIVHRILVDGQITLENIKISDIIYIGKEKIDNKKYKISSTKKYICDKFKLCNYCCIYKSENGYKKFYFQPSEQMINKINKFNLG